jgi:hypothetical protein
VYPKLFVVLQTLKIGVLDAVICFNEGSAARCNVLEVMGITHSDNMAKALAATDRLRVIEAEKTVLEGTKEERTNKRIMKRVQEDGELHNQDEYGPGIY